MKKPYTKRIEYRFEVEDETFALSEVSPTYAEIEETRKNGQEDYHQTGIVYRDSAEEPFKWSEGEDSFNDPEAVLAYINKHGMPKL